MDAMSVIAWILFVCAAIGVMASLLLYITLRARMLNFHEDPMYTLYYALIPSLFVLGLAIITVIVPTEWTALPATITVGGLVILTIICIAAAAPLVEVERTLNSECVKRVGETVRCNPDGTKLI